MNLLSIQQGIKKLQWFEYLKGVFLEILNALLCRVFANQVTIRDITHLEKSDCDYIYKQNEKCIICIQELTQKEVEYVSLSRDTTEADLKQRREILNGTAHYIDQVCICSCIVFAYLHIFRPFYDKLSVHFGVV